MKLVHLLVASAAFATAAFAQSSFPGLQKLLSSAEWQRAGLQQLTPDQIGVIDAALIRYLAAEAKTAPTAVQPPSSPTPPPGATPAEAAVVRSRFWERFGLGGSAAAAPDWRTQAPMTAKVTAWQGANRFVLDTGQVWEGLEAIPYEILGQNVIIEARPMGAFALKLNENSVAVRVHRLK
ncbi:hypothetical protein [Horticoccus sp. 23ND18S-11]|uniref:hypothetical protein n=1 Tax=Horticoccus sp. 23ND18S-11 TaxID=3391832 RepID=UPI0039C95859